jgi:hypothetical protein
MTCATGTLAERRANAPFSCVSVTERKAVFLDAWTHFEPLVVTVEVSSDNCVLRTFRVDFDELGMTAGNDPTHQVTDLELDPKDPSELATSAIGRPDLSTRPTASLRNASIYFAGRPIRASFQHGIPPNQVSRRSGQHHYPCKTESLHDRSHLNPGRPDGMLDVHTGPSEKSTSSRSDFVSSS